MEEARKHFLAHQGLNILEFWKKGIGFVVSRYEIDYAWSLVMGDDFVVETTMERVSRLKVEFEQRVYRAADRKLAVKCRNWGLPVDVQANKAVWPPELDVILAAFPIRERN